MPYSPLSMYLERQDDACTSVFRLYLALLVSDSGSGGLSRAHLKDWKQQDFQVFEEDPHEPQP